MRYLTGDSHLVVAQPEDVEVETLINDPISVYSGLISGSGELLRRGILFLTADLIHILGRQTLKVGD